MNNKDELKGIYSPMKLYSYTPKGNKILEGFLKEYKKSERNRKLKEILGK